MTWWIFERRSNHYSSKKKFKKMKKTFFALFCISFFCIGKLDAQVTPIIRDTVETIEGFRNISRYQHFYLGAQPSYEALQWLKSKGVGTIINFRSVKENTDFTSASYNEELVAKQLGFNYISIPVDGTKDYTPEKLDEFAGFLRDHKPVFIHCAGAYRVTYFFMAYLIKYQNYEMDEAIEIGKKLTFSFPLENLLDTKITMKALQE
jgi:protein tyrosine phosphatase (PTP) superfamily phosphohydrolase (DUF442 family)